MKILEVYLFTNRTTLFLDEAGEQIADLQEAFSWKPLRSYDEGKAHVALRQMMEDRPKIFIAHWDSWKLEITLNEFASLTGYGPWYWAERSGTEIKDY